MAKNTNEKVIEYILNTKNTKEEYYYNTLKQRIAGKHNYGSCYELEANSIDEKILELESKLLGTDWVETTHEELKQGSRLFKGYLPGYLGIIDIEDVSNEGKLKVLDPKKTGKVSVGIEGKRGPLVDTTYLITGVSNGITCMWTFHPGEPITPSTISSDTIKPGMLLSKDEAIRLGFKKVKIMNG
jgi:hypothetical protein